ncbi:hypothetical protein QVD17_34776 [Tagetes erecta]|uniref:Uncharacterized protein n=1 Tax=Tagetes erecta TaxID=13708 RepID=A0AAD8JZY8_TARER|nr:hypothetical protein QVD17_34776 [Tagetes erecta]
MEAQKRSSLLTSCKKHPKHRQSPGICSLCLRERLSKMLSSSSQVVSNVSSSCSSSSISSVSSVYSSHNSSNASSYTASPMQSYRNRRKIDSLEGKGYLYLLRKNTNGVFNKSRSMAFVSDQRDHVMQDHENKKLGFLSKFIGTKRTSLRMMSSTTRGTFLSRLGDVNGRKKRWV